MPPLVKCRMVGTNVAICPQTPRRQAQPALDVVHLQRLPVHLDLPHELSPARQREHAVRDAARQGEREQRLRAHREGGQVAFVALRGAHALDDIQELPAFGRLVENRCAREASEHQVLRGEEEVSQSLKLLSVLRLRAHQIVSLVHEHHLVAVNIDAALFESDLHDARHRLATLADHAESSACRGVSDCSQGRERHALAGALLVESCSVRFPDSAHVEHALHLKHLADRVTEAPHLLLRETAEVPHVKADLPPTRSPASDCRILRPLATEVVAVPVRPTQQLGVEVPAHRILRKDRHLRPRIKEVVVQNSDHFAGLPRPRGVVNKEPRDGALGVQQERYGLLVRLERRTSGRSVELHLEAGLAHLRLLHRQAGAAVKALVSGSDLRPLGIPQVCWVAVIGDVRELLRVDTEVIHVHADGLLILLVDELLSGKLVGVGSKQYTLQLFLDQACLHTPRLLAFPLLVAVKVLGALGAPRLALPSWGVAAARTAAAAVRARLLPGLLLFEVRCATQPCLRHIRLIEDSRA
mmetsp:Transcript_18851/g.54494  ORF Transcript_18851/g.54494 Transcript_18851/m.54494 type:complete len:526 (-) Transcript_18851:1579-3156(-)